MSTNPISTMTSFTTDKTTGTVPPNSNTGTIAIGVSIAILIILSMTIIIIIIIVLIWCYKRKSTKQKLYTDSPYSTLSGEIGQQIKSTQNDPADSLYDQVDLRSSTGQTEFIPKSEIANINNPNLTPYNFHPTYSIVYDNAEHSSTLDIVNQATTSQLSLHKSTSNQPIYAAVDKTKKKFKRQRKKEDPQCKSAEKGSLVSLYGHKVSSPHTIEDLHTAIKEKPKDCELKGEDKTPPVPSHTDEELYTAVQKKSKCTTSFNGDEVPPHTVDQIHAARGKPSQIIQHTTEDLYTAVMKKPNDGTADDTEVAPPIPPHTVEELYAAVMKKPKGNIRKLHQLPPYTVEEN